MTLLATSAMINAAELKSLADTPDPIAEERAVEVTSQGAPKDDSSVSDNDSLFEELGTRVSPSTVAELFAPEAAAAPEPESFEFTLEGLSDGDFRDFSNSIFACLIGFRNPSEKKAFPLYEDIKDKKVHLLFSKVRLKSLTENSVELNEIQKEIIDQLYGRSPIIEAADILMSVTGANIYGSFLRGTEEQIVEKMRIAARRYVENNAELNDDRAQLNAQITALEEKVRQAQRENAQRENAQIEVLELKKVAAHLQEQAARLEEQAAINKVSLETTKSTLEKLSAQYASLLKEHAEKTEQILHLHTRYTEMIAGKLEETKLRVELQELLQRTQNDNVDRVGKLLAELEEAKEGRAQAEKKCTAYTHWISGINESAKAILNRP